MKKIKLRLAALTMIGIAYSAPLHAVSGTWSADPVIASEACENLEWLEIAAFLETYYYSTLAYSPGDDASGAQMMQHYAVASTLVTRSQICLAEALALKELADDLREQQALLTSGTSMSKRQVKKQRKLTDEANEEIGEAAYALDQLTPEQKDRFRKGSAAYMAGTYATGKLYQAAEGFVRASAEEATADDSSSSSSKFGLDKVKSVAGKATSIFRKGTEMTIVFRGLQDHTGDLYSTSQFLKRYAKQKDIDLPADATEQLADVSDWI